MKRRSFLAGIIAAAAAPAIVRASSLMPIMAPRIIVPDGFRIPEFGWDKGWEAGDRTVIGRIDPGHTHAGVTSAGGAGAHTHPIFISALPARGQTIARVAYPGLWMAVNPRGLA